MDTKTIIETAEEHLIHTYNRYQIVLDKGDGVHLYDTDGKEYLDFGAGIAVFALGYNNKEYNDALISQIQKVIHTSNLYYNKPVIRAAKYVAEATGLDKVFFTNSGAEAIEGALKTAKRYAYDRDKKADHEIIAMNHSFHGRTMGALALTGNEHYREPFGRMIPGIKYAEFNDIKSVEKLINNKTCAIIFEPVQGEGGIYPATQEFMDGIRRICDERDILMICDEIQCGMGRTGSMYAYQQYNIVPDIVTTAKALGCGFPVGAFAVGTKCCDSLVPGDHGTTYGGNPLAATAVCKVFELFEKQHILDNVIALSTYLECRLDELVDGHENVLERRGIGLMQGIVLSTPVGDAIKKAIDRGLLVISAGNNVLRMVPPLIITKENIDDMINILDKCL